MDLMPFVNKEQRGLRDPGLGAADSYFPSELKEIIWACVRFFIPSYIEVVWVVGGIIRTYIHPVMLDTVRYKQTNT